jgi:hypothetical protein
VAERDPFELADQQDREADDMQRGSEELERDVREAREDWERKRADDAVPGAPPPEEEGDERRSPAPQAPGSAGPGDAETPPEGGAGPPADTLDT